MAATPEQIALLRRLIADTVVPYKFTDDQLSDSIDAASEDLNLAASRLWIELAGIYSSSVDITENGSTRKMGDLYKNALAMAAQFGQLSSPGPTPVGRGVRIRPIVRGGAEV